MYRLYVVVVVARQDRHYHGNGTHVDAQSTTFPLANGLDDGVIVYTKNRR
jgi:hypothetical protein